MDHVTIFGDIHGNLSALEAVFQDMETRDLANLYCLGDLVGYGTFPNEVVEAVRGRNVPTLMGAAMPAERIRTTERSVL